MTEECCDEKHPMDYRPRRVRAFSLFDTKDPIPAQLEDTKEFKELFQKWNFVPFASTDKVTGHRLLYLYKLLYERSPTHRGCIEKIATYAFGTSATTMRATDPEFDTGEEVQPPSTQERKEYKENGLSIVKFDRPIKEFFRQLCKDKQWAGNMWFQVNIAEVNGEFGVYFKIHKQENVLYLTEDVTVSRVVAVSPQFDDAYLDKYPPEYLPLFPEFREENGVKKTMFHYKEGDFVWYGRPRSGAALENMFEEQQATSYRVRAAAKEFTGKRLIETEDPEGYAVDPKTAADERAAFVKEFEENYTQAGVNPQGVVLLSRPFKAAPMTVHEVPPNTDHDYFRGISELDEKEILKAHQVTRKFMSLETASRYTSQVGFVEDFVLNMEPVIYDHRHTVLNFVNTALSWVWEMTGREYLNTQSLWFGSPIDVSVEQYKKGQIIPDNTNDGFDDTTGDN